MITDNLRKFLHAFFCVSLAFLIFSSSKAAKAQNLDRIEKQRAKTILNNIKNEIKKSYYDPNFHGIDLDTRFTAAEEKLDKAVSIGQAFSIIAQVLVDFDDSHLFFLPPATNVEVDYGWKMSMVGDKCFVTGVKPKSDANDKGLKIGDQILTLEGFRPTRKDLWKMSYYYNALNPKTKLRLVVQSPGSNQFRELELNSKITRSQRIIDLSNSMDIDEIIRGFDDGNKLEHRFQKVGNIMIWKMPSFGFDPVQVDSIMKNQANKGSSLIIDLRGNGGGLVKTLESLVGYFFETDVKIADLKGRKVKEGEPMFAKTRGKDVYKGKLAVLIDSQSGSAAEIFPRLIQLEKRGVVIGDVSSGSVMQSVRPSGKTGGDKEVWYGLSVTNADVIMSDGKSIEHVGVIPDELVIPSAEDLAKGRDPVLSRAIEILGGSLPPEQAGKLFPDKWADD